MARDPGMNLVLIGMKHCGKSTAGAMLASRRGEAFHDVDEVIERIHARDAGTRLNIREIFRTRGEPFFEELEAKAVEMLAQEVRSADGGHVIALAGRTPLNPRIQALLPNLGLIVYLKADGETLYERVERGGLPPFLDPHDPKGDFLRMVARRTPHYERLATITVNVDGLDPDQVADAVESHIKEYERGGQ
jgi:shikimate kinase